MRMKKSISVIMVILLAFFITICGGDIVSKAASSLTAKKKSITVKVGKTKKIQFVAHESLSINCSVVSGDDRISCKWEKWKGNRINLKVKGVGSGKAKIKITNTHDKKIIYINVKVTGAPTIKLPSTPFTIYYSDGIHMDDVGGAIFIDKLSYSLKKRKKDYLLTLHFSGIKTSGGSLYNTDSGFVFSRIKRNGKHYAKSMRPFSSCTINAPLSGVFEYGIPKSGTFKFEFLGPLEYNDY